MAYNFNGTSQYMSITGSFIPIPLIEVPLTVSLWFKTPTASQSTARVLLEFGVFVVGGRGYRLVIPANQSFIRANAYEGSTARTADTAAGSIVANTWMHATAVFASTTSRTIYLSNATPVTNTQSVTVGDIDDLTVASATTATNYFNGDIAEVGVWRTSLNSDEINSLSKGVSCKKIRPNLIFCYFPMVRELNDEFANIYTFESSSYPFSLFPNNNPTPSDHPRIYS